MLARQSPDVEIPVGMVVSQLWSTTRAGMMGYVISLKRFSMRKHTDQETGNMIVIKSQEYPVEKRVSEEMSCFLEDVNAYSDRELTWLRKQVFIHMQLKRFTREELKLLVGHTDWMIRQRKKP